MAPIGNFESFLLLIGSVFAPLFGVLLADHFILRRRKLDNDGVGAFHVPGFIAGACGIAAYQALSRLAPTVGATLPAFLVSAVVYLGLRSAQRMPMRR